MGYASAAFQLQVSSPNGEDHQHYYAGYPTEEMAKKAVLQQSAALPNGVIARSQALTAEQIVKLEIMPNEIRRIV